MMIKEFFAHNTADVSDKAQIGKGSFVWNNAQIREEAILGENVIISKGVYVDKAVHIGKNVKIQNNVSVFQGVKIEDGVFVGPHVCFTNDKTPRAINKDGSLKKGDDWDMSPTVVKEGASIGANSTILPGIKIGKFAMIGAGSVVTKNVKDHALVLGNPAKEVGFVCHCGTKMVIEKDMFYCPRCKTFPDFEFEESEEEQKVEGKALDMKGEDLNSALEELSKHMDL